MPTAFEEDFFERVVDVQWMKRGIIVVGGDVCCFNWYAMIRKKGGRTEINFHPIGTLGFDDVSTNGAAYGCIGKDKKNKIKGHPVFCLGGARSEGSGDSAVSILSIYTSSDGQGWGESWSQTYGQGEDQPSIDGGGYHNKTLNIGEMTSDTGYGWSPGGGGGRDDGGGTNEKGEYHSAGEFGFDYLVYAGGVWCGASGQVLQASLDDGETWEYVGQTDTFDFTCIAGGALDDQPGGGE